MSTNATSIHTPFFFELPTAIRYEKAAVRRVPQDLAGEGYARILLVTDGGVTALPFYRELLAGLKEKGIAVKVYDEVEANPKDRNVTAAAEAARECAADAILAVGGGSPIDCAKAVSVVAVGGGAVRDYAGGRNMPENPLPLYSLPTTAGTGSEITFSAVITDTDEKFKFTVKSPRIAPRVAYLDPEVTMSKPPQLTASTGLDALTHAIEAYTATGAEVVSDAAALHAVELISTHLLTAVREGANEDARAGMLTGSLLAGIAFSHADVASVHCLAEALGGLYDLPHGVCNAIALPVVMEYNMDYALERYARLAEALGVSNTTETGSGAGTGAGAAVRQKAEAAVQAVRTLAVESGLPPFTSLGVEEKDFEHIAEMSERNGSNASNPRPMKKADYLELLRRLSEQ